MLVRARTGGALPSARHASRVDAADEPVWPRAIPVGQQTSPLTHDPGDGAADFFPGDGVPRRPRNLVALECGLVRFGSRGLRRRRECDRDFTCCEAWTRCR